MLDEKKPIVFKVFKPIRDVAPEEVIAALNVALDGNVSVEHRNDLASESTRAARGSTAMENGR